MGKMAIILAALAGQATAQTPPVPMQPTSQWTVEYADTACLVSRRFGDGASQIKFGLQRVGLASTMDLIIASGNNADKLKRRGSAKITIGQSKAAISRPLVSLFQPRTNERVSLIEITAKDLKELRPQNSIVIHTPKNPVLFLDLVGISDALNNFDNCINDMMTRWGVGPDQMARIVVLPKLKIREKDLITFDDYPEHLYELAGDNVTEIMWLIGTDGKSSNCRILRSSGFPDLDVAACSAVLANARYFPALDKDNKPVISYSSKRFVWQSLTIESVSFDQM